MNLKKFLAVAFMCHQRPDRSFFICGKQLPLCARCTGILIGYFLGILIACVTKCQNHLLILTFVIPMTVDGAIQLIFKAESNNWRRLFTGILGGIGIIYIFINIHIFTVWWVRIVMRHWHIIP